jgi:hypothetical protein
MNVELFAYRLKVLKATEKAVHVSHNGESEEAVWLPKSQIDWAGAILLKKWQTFGVPKWLIERNYMPFSEDMERW